MKILKSLRGRFLLSILIWVALGIGAIWYSSVRLFASHVESQYHEELEVHVRELGGLTQLDAEGRPVLVRPLSDPRYEEPLSGFYWQVTRPQFGTIKSPSMTRGGLDYDIAHSPNILHRFADGPTGLTIVYGFIREVPPGPPIHFVIATDERHLQRIIKSFTRELSVWLVLLAAALLASGIAIVTIGFRPLKALAGATARLRNGEAARLEGVYPSEIAPLVTDLNAYAENNGTIVRRARVQAANLAHSLRTPLAVIIDEAEQLSTTGRLGKAATVFLAEADKMSRQIEYHLARARSVGSGQAVGAASNLQSVLPALISAMQRIHPAKEFKLAGDLAASPMVKVDADDLSEILSNLLDNAGKWARQTIIVDWLRDADEVSISIIDDGPGIAKSERSKVFEAGYRSDVTRDGSGLGLTISRDIAEDYGGSLRFDDVQPNLFAVVAVLPSTALV